MRVLGKSKILINDSCVLFDLADLNLLNDFFELEYSFYTTPQVISEIRDEVQLVEMGKFIDNSSLIVDSNGDFESIQLIYDKYAGLSYADSSVLELAIRLEGILLSSDKALRNISKRINLDVRGVLWVIKELVIKRMISKETAEMKLKEYPEINIRVPLNEIKKLINDLQKE